MRALRRSLAVSSLVVGGLALSPTVDAAPAADWTVIGLQPLDDGDDVRVDDLNDAGMAVGRSRDQYVRWDANGEPTALSTPEGVECFGTWEARISDDGHVTGFLACSGPGEHTGLTVWDPDGTRHELGFNALAESVDDLGIVTGSLNEDGYHAFAALDGHPLLRLPEAGAEASFALGHTNWGYVVGALRDVPTLPQDVAVGWYGDQVFPLMATAQRSYARAVNEYGVALVITSDDTDAYRGQLVAPGGAHLALDDSGERDHLFDINDAGIVVGSKVSDDGDTIDWDDDVAAGMFYVGDQIVRLDTLVSDEDAAEFDLRWPIAVNNAAWVVGNRGGDPYNGAGAWLLKPPGVPSAD